MSVDVTPTARHARRRPSGAPPPLPRSIGTTGLGWIITALVMVALTVLAFNSKGVRRVVNEVDAFVLRGFAELRTPWLTDVMSAVSRAGSGWGVTAVSAVFVLALIVLKRWRHLFTFFGTMLVLQLVGVALYGGLPRPRPYDVTIIGRWAGFSLLDPPLAIVAFVLVAVVYSLVPAGRGRVIGKVVAAAARRALRVLAAVPGHLPPVRHRHRGEHRRGPRGQRLPLLHPERGVPGGLPAGQDRPPRRHRPAGRGPAPGGGVAARAHGARHQAGGPRGLGGLDAVAPEDRRRPRDVPVREALRHEPRPGGPLVQARPDDPLRAAGGRGAVPVGAPLRRVRGLHGQAPARHRRAHRRARRHRRAHARARVPASSPSSSTVPRRSGTPRSTTT